MEDYCWHHVFSNEPFVFGEFASQMDFFMDRSTARIRAVGGGGEGLVPSPVVSRVAV